MSYSITAKRKLGFGPGAKLIGLHLALLLCYWLLHLVSLTIVTTAALLIDPNFTADHYGAATNAYFQLHMLVFALMIVLIGGWAVQKATGTGRGLSKGQCIAASLPAALLYILSGSSSLELAPLLSDLSLFAAVGVLYLAVFQVLVLPTVRELKLSNSAAALSAGAIFLLYKLSPTLLGIESLSPAQLVLSIYTFGIAWTALRSSFVSSRLSVQLLLFSSIMAAEGLIKAVFPF